MRNNNLKIVFTFVGTFIGAGFASGREIALFFGGKSVLSPILAALFCGSLAFVFMEIGRITNGGLTGYLFPKTQRVWDGLIKSANFVIFSAMLAGAEYTIKETTGFVGGGIASGLLAAAIVVGGMEKIKSANFIAVPIIIAMCAVMFALEPNFYISGAFNLINPLLYASMNILSCGLLSAKLSAGGSRKQSLICSAMIALILGLLIVLVYLLVGGREQSEMPLMDLAKSLNLGLAGSLLILIAIMTTMSGSLSLASEGKPALTVALLCGGLLVSTLGFKNIVDTTYPAIGVLGAVISFAGMARLARAFWARRKRITGGRILTMRLRGDII
ncbi:MAG TPA: hypothetical protein PLS05_01965 [Clostridia bacterium]|nr:hypothetical protein [Clostridia bacterium]HOL60631.1 hypothetical protein [Clostridia bacterium]